MLPEIHIHNSEKFLLLFDLSHAFSALTELDELLQLINAKTKEVLEAESSAILLLDEATGELFFPVSSDASPEVENASGRSASPPTRESPVGSSRTPRLRSFLMSPRTTGSIPRSIGSRGRGPGASSMPRCGPGAAFSE
jgi:hypothetical protein